LGKPWHFWIDLFSGLVFLDCSRFGIFGLACCMLWNSLIREALVFLDWINVVFGFLGLCNVWHFWIGLFYGLEFFV
jgi:hypothetical protein